MLDIDVGFDLFVKARCRLARINAPELTTTAGVLAKGKLIEMLGPWQGECLAEITGRDKYGRWLANVYGDNGGYCVNDLLVKEGYATYV